MTTTIAQAKRQVHAEQAAALEIFRQRGLLDLAERELATALRHQVQRHDPDRVAGLHQRVADLQQHIAGLEAA